jgi:hypothetical protein
MPLHKWSDLIDERYPPGTAERRRFEYFGRRARRMNAITDRVYAWSLRLPFTWATVDDEYFGPMNHRGVGAVVGQYWADSIRGLLEWFEYRNDPDNRPTLGHVFYGALDGLAWRFFNDEYVPTWKDVKSGKSGIRRWSWRMRRRQAYEVAEHRADEYFRENTS